MKKVKRIIFKIQIRWKNSLLRKNLKLKKEIKRLETLLAETKKQNHFLLDQKNLDEIKIRELKLEVDKH